MTAAEFIESQGNDFARYGMYHARRLYHDAERAVDAFQDACVVLLSKDPVTIQAGSVGQYYALFRAILTFKALNAHRHFRALPTELAYHEADDDNGPAWYSGARICDNPETKAILKESWEQAIQILTKAERLAVKARMANEECEKSALCRAKTKILSSLGRSTSRRPHRSLVTS